MSKIYVNVYEKPPNHPNCHSSRDYQTIQEARTSGHLYSSGARVVTLELDLDTLFPKAVVEDGIPGVRLIRGSDAG